jgi:hypothetical protein
MMFSLTGHGKNIGEDQLYVKIPPQVVGAAHNQDNIGAMLNHSGVKSAQQPTSGISANTVVDHVYFQFVFNQ